jgi:hypothetical protein
METLSDEPLEVSSADAWLGRSLLFSTTIIINHIVSHIRDQHVCFARLIT